MCVENIVTLATNLLSFTAVTTAMVVATAKGPITFGEYLERERDAH